MNTHESYEKAGRDMLDMLERWQSEGLVVSECLFAGLIVMIGATIRCSPNRKSAQELLDIAMTEAAKIEE